jgi:hypothetical protein
MQESEHQYEMAKNAILETILDSDFDHRKRIGLCSDESKINLFKNDFSLENSITTKLKETFCLYGKNITLFTAYAT